MVSLTHNFNRRIYKTYTLYQWSTNYFIFTTDKLANKVTGQKLDVVLSCWSPSSKWHTKLIAKLLLDTWNVRPRDITHNTLSVLYDSDWSDTILLTHSMKHAYSTYLFQIRPVKRWGEMCSNYWLHHASGGFHVRITATIRDGIGIVFGLYLSLCDSLGSEGV